MLRLRFLALSAAAMAGMCGAVVACGAFGTSATNEVTYDGGALGDAAEAAAPDAAETSTHWVGTLDKAAEITFGGSPGYCLYGMTLTSVKFDVVVEGGRASASGSGFYKMTERVIDGGCVGALGTTSNYFTVVSAVTLPLATGGFHIELIAGPTNGPITSLVLETTPTASGMNAIILVTRTDGVAAVNWVAKESFPMTRQ